MAKRRADFPPRHKSARNAQLWLATGLLDYVPKPVKPGDPVWERALHAFGRRDDWGYREHGGFFTALLPEWPTSGRKPARDSLSLAMALLVADGLTERQAADALDVSWEAVRPRHSPGRERASLERGQELLSRQQRESHAVLLGRWAGRLWDPLVALPRVITTGEEEPEPDEAFFNPLVELLDGMQRGSDSGALYLARAQKKRRALWRQLRLQAPTAPT